MNDSMNETKLFCFTFGYFITTTTMKMAQGQGVYFLKHRNSSELCDDRYIVENISGWIYAGWISKDQKLMQSTKDWKIMEKE